LVAPLSSSVASSDAGARTARWWRRRRTMPPTETEKHHSSSQAVTPVEGWRAQLPAHARRVPSPRRSVVDGDAYAYAHGCERGARRSHVDQDLHVVVGYAVVGARGAKRRRRRKCGA
jgi:hypothetical protein